MIMDAAIVAVGSELLSGVGADTNTRVIAERLTTLGIRVTRSLSVPDDDKAAADDLRRLAKANQAVVITGGLGPTFDDVTRELVSTATGVRLERDEAALAAVRSAYEARGREASQGALRQADVLSGAEVIPPRSGTAPGQMLRHKGVLHVLLPGVPAEMIEMLDRHVVPRLQELFSLTQARRVRRVRLTGIPESEVEARIADLRLEFPLVAWSLLVGPDEIQLVVAETPGAAAGAVNLDRVAAEAEAALGEVVFGKDSMTLEGAVVGLLGAAEQTLAVAESCTGGLIAERITSVAGASAAFRGGVVAYSDEAKRDWLLVPGEELERYGAVSRPVASRMAESIRLSRRADYGLAVTGIAGPAGGSAEKPVGLVYVALAKTDGVEVARHLFAGDRAGVRRRASQAALDMLRLSVSAHIARGGRS